MITDYEDNLNSVYPGPFKHIKVFIKTFMRRKETSKLKLINSLTEHRIRQALIESEGKFFASEEGKKILALLEPLFSEIRSIYMLHYLWDEGEEWYDFLVNGDAVVEIEREEENRSMNIIKSIDINEYQSTIKGRGKTLKLMIAMELSKKIS